MLISAYPLSVLTARYKGIFWKCTICLKFQLIIKRHPATVASATWNASVADLGVTMPASRSMPLS